MFFIEWIINIITDVLLLAPGACIRWIMGGCKRPFKEVMDECPGTNSSAGKIFMAIVLVIMLVVVTVVYKS